MYAEQLFLYYITDDLCGRLPTSRSLSRKPCRGLAHRPADSTHTVRSGLTHTPPRPQKENTHSHSSTSKNDSSTELYTSEKRLTV